MRVICAGEMLVDIFVRPVQQIPFENDTQIVPDIRITSGGDANNNAINFAKLGHQVAYLGRLGCDEMGDYVASLAQAAGIDISHTVRSSTARQTKSVILVNPKGDRTFLQDPGTSAEFCFDDCDLSLLDWAEMLQIGGAFHLPKFDCGATSFLRNSDKIYEKKRNASQAPGRRFWPSAAARTRTRSWRPLWTRWWPPGSLIVRSVGWRWTTRPTPCDCYCSKWGGM